MPALLELLDIKGMTVTADAIHTQRNAAKQVTEAEGKPGDASRRRPGLYGGPGNAGKMLRFTRRSSGYHSGHRPRMERHYWRGAFWTSATAEVKHNKVQKLDSRYTS
ncbi:MAG: hypothetical protein OXD42_05550 [Rhodospirillaceae bacterium]|nr:hypothetical protein [Rhodospirillaceae bacterium]MCY4237894.1 hypothetical protein [Rhodospirillaceae bacterium]